MTAVIAAIGAITVLNTLALIELSRRILLTMKAQLVICNAIEKLGRNNHGMDQHER